MIDASEILLKKYKSITGFLPKNKKKNLVELQ